MSPIRIVKLTALLSAILFLAWFSVQYAHTSDLIDRVCQRARDFVEFNHEALNVPKEEIEGFAYAMCNETIDRYPVSQLEDLPVGQYFMPRGYHFPKHPHRGGGDE